jgi:uncharacterized protein (DUF2249 family)
MITKDLKISKLLREYPDTLDILLKLSPHFSKLQNKFLRKTLAGRVTIAQAASIAGIALTDLLNELRKAAAPEEIKENYQEDPEDADHLLEIRTLQKHENLNDLASYRQSCLDVRPIINAGKDPLKDILNKIRELEKDEALVIINSFEPIPLYSLLAKKGFRHLTEKGDDAFKVYFYQKSQDEIMPGESETQYDMSKQKVKEEEAENIIDIDVHDLQPPEPMMKILENLWRIDENSVMIVQHHREPNLLYPILEERGYNAVCDKTGENNFRITIRKKINR